MTSETQVPAGRTGADFISISSSDDDLPSPKRKRSPKSASTSPPAPDGVADKTSPRTSSDRSHKRARLLSSSAGGSGSDARSETRVSREGEVGDIEDAASDHAKKKRQARGEEKDADDNADTAAEQSAEGAGASGIFVPQDPPLFVQDSLSLRLPVFSQKREGSWHTRFQDWVQLLLTSNHEHAAAMTPSLVHDAYKQYIDCHSGLKQAKRRGAKETSAKLETSGELAELLKTMRSSIGSRQHEGASAGMSSQVKASDELLQVDPVNRASDEGSATKTGPVAQTAETSIPDVIVLSSDGPQDSAEVAPPVPSSPPQSNGLEMPAVAHRKGVPLGADALAQQRRYFPSAADPANMCLLCGREGHVAIECRDSACRFCSKDDHWDFVCPTIPTRCGKCRQLGHSTAKCTEKLALTDDEGLECFYCKSLDHLEDACTEWWRSYEPLAHLVKTISHLPSSCAACGSGQHYAGDCPQRQRGGPNLNPTWTARNCNMYIDPASSSAAVEESYSQVGRPKASHQPDLRIRGSAAPRTHIQYESEDSDVEFLGQRASARKPKIGQIRVSSNIQMPNENRHHSSLPLAPPRTTTTTTSSFPPPPGTRGNAGYSLPTGPPPSLPSRPPIRTFHGVPPPASLSNNARGGFGGGRGGGRGRGGRGGRGRGRGK